ncbi:hypothetical protein [Humibacter sp. RRB41]|uniref:hypothetical protein n=1 Tax=Humibacter sp. RRB41 TaxID=2919946 RepID=UPI001FAA9B0C|nr:hypothetical protein [Humibacter sp. RRB41]
MTRVRRAAVAVPLVLALAFGSAAALTGCSVQGIVKNVTHGHVDLGGKSVPSDFPKEVPLAKGEVIYGASVGSSNEKVWNVTVKVMGADAGDAIGDQLAGAGFTRGMNSKTDTGATASFTKEPYSVLVVVAKDNHKGWVANYTVTQKK